MKKVDMSDVTLRLQSADNSTHPDNMSERVEARDNQIPISIDLMAQLITTIAMVNYDIRGEDIRYNIQICVDDSFYIGYYSGEMNQEDDLFEDPDFHTKMTEMMNDLSGLNISRKVKFNTEGFCFHCQKKMDLFKLLCNYLEDEDYKLLTLDNVPSIAATDIDIWKDQIAHRLQLKANDAKVDIRENPEYGKQMLEAVDPIPYVSLKHYFAALAKLKEAQVPYLLTHILKTIQHEDKIPQSQKQERAFIHGGYN